jgi:hypothetical protein
VDEFTPESPKAEGNAALEFHDSELSVLEIQGDSLTLHFAPAYVHRSKGTPGVDPGTGWTQNATVSLLGARLSGAVRLGLPSLADGELTLGDHHSPGLLPAPASYVGPVTLMLVFLDDSRLWIRATELRSTLSGEPTYVEDFAGPD